ncbi:hypothetical protein [Mycobacterium sp. JS623]|uniref:hypothetical protein n=1 Tax=Mycobacterium sp. JS623 TaxID=212767 RepID=UPI001E2C8ED5|nr:hypothetical protein [Mycobacterium sp. JS623]
MPSILMNIDGHLIGKHHPVVLTEDEVRALTANAPQRGAQAGARSLGRRVRPQALRKNAAVAILFGSLVEAKVGQHPPRVLRQRDAATADAHTETAEQ